MRIYVASSWRNKQFDHVVEILRGANHQVYDFKNVEGAFHWTQLDPTYEHGKTWGGHELISYLSRPLAQDGFKMDMGHLEECDVCVLVLPCGRSAHLEAGWAVGAGKKVIVFIPMFAQVEPELMYNMTTKIITSYEELLKELDNGRDQTRSASGGEESGGTVSSNPHDEEGAKPLGVSRRKGRS